MDRDLSDIKQKLVDVETALHRNQRELLNAVQLVDNQVGKLVELLSPLMKQSQER